MSDTTAILERKLGTAGELRSVVRTMKAMAASRVGQYRDAMVALDAYYHTVQTGLALCVRRTAGPQPSNVFPATTSIEAIVFGSDQGMVGQFNDTMYAYAMATLAPMDGKKTVWPVGARIAARFAGGPLAVAQSLPLPVATPSITALVGQILIALDAAPASQVLVFHQQPLEGGAFSPACLRLLPLDAAWLADIGARPWPGTQLPQLIGTTPATLADFFNEFLFVSLFRACAESQASENASRLLAMQRAETNIDHLRDELQRSVHRLRQSDIDAELFDLLAGFEALAQDRGR